MKTEWLLVANATHARVLRREDESRITLLQTFEHPKSRLQSSDVGKDEAGRALSRRGTAAVPLEPRVDAQTKEHLHFAHELATFLESAASENKYESLVMVASNPFLGELKQALHDGAHRRLTATVPVDLTGVGLHELASRIGQHLAAHH
jgi:protein required for attachment to host cells